jgi:hypothetical protein
LTLLFDTRAVLQPPKAAIELYDNSESQSIEYNIPEAFSLASQLLQEKVGQVTKMANVVRSLHRALSTVGLTRL